MTGTTDPALRNVAAAVVVVAAALGASYLSSDARAPGARAPDPVVEHTLDVALRRSEPSGDPPVTQVSLSGAVVGDSTDPGVWERLHAVARSEVAGLGDGELVLTGRIAVSLARRIPPDHLAQAKTALRRAGVEAFLFAPLVAAGRPRRAVHGPTTIVPVHLRREPGGLAVILDGRRAGTDAEPSTWAHVGRLALPARRKREAEAGAGARVVFEIHGDDRTTTRELAAAGEALLAVGIPDVTIADGR